MTVERNLAKYNNINKEATILSCIIPLLGLKEVIREVQKKLCREIYTATLFIRGKTGKNEMPNSKEPVGLTG